MHDQPDHGPSAKSSRRCGVLVIPDDPLDVRLPSNARRFDDAFPTMTKAKHPTSCGKKPPVGPAGRRSETGGPERLRWRRRKETRGRPS
jgi:hypothetical protein